MDALSTVLILIVLFIAIIVAISRWVFRVNDIVRRLDKIIALMEKRDKETKQLTSDKKDL
jgi:hypothetical protein